MPHISIISPVYRAENIVDKLVQEIVKAVSPITSDFEIILVEDGSPDCSWERISLQCAQDKRVKGIKLSRNFGQHNAIFAGLIDSSGDWIVVMDCDLQDKPEEILKLYRKAEEGFDIVLARRVNRQDHTLKRWMSIVFYKLFSYLTETHQDPAIANFGIYRNTVIKSVQSMGDYVRVFPILVQWVGFKRVAIDVEHNFRLNGKTSYNFLSLVRLASNMIISFSEKPLKIGLQIGIIISFFSLLFGIYNFIKFLKGEILVPGYTSLILSIWFFSGFIIAFIGLTGLYIGKIFEKVKNRPNFIISKRI